MNALSNGFASDTQPSLRGEVPGTSKTFTWLRQQGVKLALNTGFEAGDGSDASFGSWLGC